MVYATLGESQKAIAGSNQAIVLNPNFAEAYINRGGIQTELREYQKAFVDLQKAATLFQEQVDLTNAKEAVELSQKQRNTEAYQIALELIKADQDLNNSITQLRAIAYYNQVIFFNSKDADAYNNRGVAYNNLGEFKKAIDDFNQAIVFNPNLAEAYYSNCQGDYDIYGLVINAIKFGSLSRL